MSDECNCALCRMTQEHAEDRVPRCSHPLAETGAVYACTLEGCPVHGERNRVKQGHMEGKTMRTTAPFRGGMSFGLERAPPEEETGEDEDDPWAPDIGTVD